MDAEHSICLVYLKGRLVFLHLKVPCHTKHFYQFLKHDRSIQVCFTVHVKI